MVTTLTDENDPYDGQTSLREAIAYANLGAASGDSIEFQSGLSGTISLSSTLNITKALTIDGPGAATLIIDGNNATQIFNIDDGNPATSLPVSISGLTLTRGRAVNDVGGAIRNSENLTLTNSTLTGNSASYGGGIFDRGTVTLTNCTLAGNSAGSDGGGIFNSSARLTLTNCTLPATRPPTAAAASRQQRHGDADQLHPVGQLRRRRRRRHRQRARHG